MKRRLALRSTTCAAVLLAFGLGAAQADVESYSWGYIFKGDYIQTGFNNYGTFGHDYEYGAGFVFDGTGTGTFNTAYDYLAPGTPWEGFSASDGSNMIIENNNAMSYAGTLGTLTNYSGIAYGGHTYDYRAVWQGETTQLSITNDMHFNQTDKAITVSTTLTAKSDINSLYFARFTDPDAVAASGDSSVTNNTTVTEGSATYVYGEALVSKYVIGLLTNEANSAARIVRNWVFSNGASDPQQYYLGTETGALDASGTDGDSVIGLGFSLGHLAAGESISIIYKYIFGTDIADAVDPGVDVPNTVTEIGQTIFATTQQLARVSTLVERMTQQEVRVHLPQGNLGVTISSMGKGDSDPRMAIRASGLVADNGDLGRSSNAALTFGYAINANLTAGGFVQISNLDNGSEGFDFDGNLVGFGGYLRSADPSGLGLTWKVSIGRAGGDGNIARPGLLQDTEAGTGEADIRALGLLGEVGYGYGFGNGILTPYAQLSYTRTTRDGYTETGVDNPITFESYAVQATSLTLGAEYFKPVSDVGSLSLAAGVEFDLSRKASNIRGTSGITGLESFDLQAPDASDDARAFVSASYRHMVGAGNIIASFGVTEEAYSGKPTGQIGLTYEVRF